MFLFIPRLKRYSWLNTYVGAIPGALPLLGGWFATGAPIHLQLLLYFLLYFVGKYPIFMRYQLCILMTINMPGFEMLPNQKGGIKATKRQMLFFSILMILSSIYPFFIGFLVNVYLWYGDFINCFYFNL